LLLLSSSTSAPATFPSGSETRHLQLAGAVLRLRGGLKKKMVIHSLSDIRGDDDAKGIPAGAMAGPVDGEKLSKRFMGMYHEKQIGGLCAVHCMNNLMQGPEFDEIEVRPRDCTLARAIAVFWVFLAVSGKLRC